MSAYAQARTLVVAKPKGPRCTMGRLLEGLDPKDRADVQADLDGDVMGTTIGQGLKEIGHPIKQFILDRHRRGDCSCS